MRNNVLDVSYRKVEDRLSEIRLNALKRKVDGMAASLAKLRTEL